MNNIMQNQIEIAIGGFIITSLINFFILYLVIKNASKSEALLRNSTAQLKVIIEMALAAGVPPEKIKNEIVISETATLEQARNDNNDGT